MEPSIFQQFFSLEERARAARTLPELVFSIANEPWQLAPYRQGIVWRVRESRPPALSIISGLAQLSDDSPYTVWLRELGVWLVEKVGQQPTCISAEQLPDSLSDGWHEWMPEHLMVFPIIDPAGRRVALSGYACEALPDEERQVLLERLMGTFGHAWAALAPARSPSRLRQLKRARVAIAVAALLLMLIPVRLSVLAPAEVIALDARVISSPMDGVIGSFDVKPNESVTGGQRVFTLDDTTLRNRREVVAKGLQVARADALAAAQKAFDSDASRAELASLNGKVAERHAELAYVEDQLRRIEVRSPGEGVVVFGDINDWQGKPVVTGERIALLADPRDAGVMVWLPVAEAINLDPGAEVRLYLQVAPLSPLSARLSQTSYQAAQSPDGVSAYRLRATFDDPATALPLARIGLKGTAKIYGERAPLIYYLLRRPLASVREFLGI